MKKNLDIDLNLINKEDIIIELFNQIRKDFDNNLNPQFQFIEDLSFQGVANLIAKDLEILLAKRHELLLQGLYKLDVPEGLYNAALSSNEPTKALTELIIKRALQKVVLRRHFS